MWSVCNREPEMKLPGGGPQYEDTDWGWPIGWMITYLTDGAPGTDVPPVRTGVIAGPAEQCASTGHVRIPVRGVDDPPQTAITWVPDSSVLNMWNPHPPTT